MTVTRPIAKPMMPVIVIDSQKKQREFHLAFWQVSATLLGGAAAFFAAGVAVVKLFGH